MLTPRWLRKTSAFIQRDFLESVSYRLPFFLDFLGVIANLFIFFFVAKLIGAHKHPLLEPYGGHYFNFVLIGIALSGYQSAALRGYARSIHTEIAAGTLEAILITPTKIDTVMLIGAFWTFTLASVRIIVYLLVGGLLFGANLSGMNFFGTALTLLLTMAALSGLGIFSAGFILIFKKGDPLGYFIDGASRILSGVYFPLALFPEWVGQCSLALPLTHSLSAMRKAVLQGQGISQLLPELLALSVFAAVLLPLGLFFFRRAVLIAKKQGSLIFH